MGEVWLFVPFLAIVLLAAVIWAVYVLIAPVAALVFCILLPFLPTMFLGAPLHQAVPILVYEAIVLAVLYALKRKKSDEISKW